MSELEFRGEKKKPFKVGTVLIVDMQTGEVVEERRNSMTLLPPGGDACAECAVEHGIDQPHDVHSLYYRMAFLAKNGREPGWRDALAHCPPPVRVAWEAELRKRGLWGDGLGGLGEP